MAPLDVETVMRLLGLDRREADLDVVELFRDPETEARLDELIAPDGVIEFAAPDGGFVGAMGVPFRGPQGLRTGWLEWLVPWEPFVVRRLEWVDIGDGRVLTLGHSVARMASGVEVETPAGALYTLRDGRVTRIQHFLDQVQARRAAGIEGDP